MSRSGRSCCSKPTLSRYASQADKCCLPERGRTHGSSRRLQFDKVQESFFSLEQQTSTFQAHLLGLGNGTLGESEASGAQSNNDASPSVFKQASQVSVEHRGVPSTSQSTLTGPDSRTPLSLRERSALHFSSTLGRLRRSVRRK